MESILQNAVQAVRPDGTGVGNTRAISRLDTNVFIDWLAFTLPIPSADDFGGIPFDENGEYISFRKESSLNSILERFLALLHVQRDDYYFLEHGGNGYRSGLSIGENITVLLGGGPKNKNGDNTIGVILTGKGCRQFDNYDLYSWPEFIRILVKDFGASFTRIDFSCDIFNENFFTLDRFIRKITNRHCVTPSKQFHYEHSTLDSAGEYAGKTLYVGSRSSARYLCSYDKRLERIAQNRDCDVWSNVWNRFEMRYKDKWANRVAYAIADLENDDEMPVLFKGLLFDFLDIKTRSRNDVANPSDLPTCKWWLDFLDHVSKTKLANQGKIESDLVKKKEWFAHSVSRFLSMQLISDETDFNDFIYRNISLRSEKFNDKDLVEVNVERKRLGLEPVTIEYVMDRLRKIREEFDLEEYKDEVEELIDE